MREYVAALRAIWSDWDGGEPLAFKGEHYRLTLMTDTFRPEPAELPHPPVHVAAVGRHMTRLAGEVGDGLIPHSFSTADWFREVTLPAVREGLERAGRDRSTFVVHCPGMVVVTAEEGPTDAQLRQVRAQIAFYGSTPAYADVLRFHGWSALYEALHQLSVTDDPQRWERMTELVDDEVLAAFGVIGPLREVCKELASRYGTDVDVVHLHPPQGTGAEELKLARALLEGE
jgi:probable F420-dependent oxidoreductase